MVILNNELRDELWSARFYEELSRKECVRRFVTLKLACRSEVYATLRQFEGSTTSQYMGRRQRQPVVDEHKDRSCGPVRRSQCRSHITRQSGDEQQNWVAIESQRYRWRRKEADIALPRGNLRACGWQLFRGHKSAGHQTLCGTEQTLTAVLPRWRVEKLAKLVRRTVLCKRLRQATFLFGEEGKADKKRLAFTRRNTIIRSCIAAPMARAAQSVAQELKLPGRLYDNHLTIIVSFSGASNQLPHVDVHGTNSFSLLFPLHKRWVHVRDRGGGGWRRLTLRAGDLLVMQGQTCHAAAAHQCRRTSILMFVAWNWDIGEHSFACVPPAPGVSGPP